MKALVIDTGSEQVHHLHTLDIVVFSVLSELVLPARLLSFILAFFILTSHHCMRVVIFSSCAQVCFVSLDFIGADGDLMRLAYDIAVGMGTLQNTSLRSFFLCLL